MENENIKHTFVICAYKESPYLEECIKSLKHQKTKSVIKLATSTPCKYLESMCEKYDIEYCVRDGISGIAADWNYAYSLADTDYVTIAHQDDVYHPEYVRCILEYMRRCQKMLIAFTDYSEMRNGKECIGGLNLYIKRFLLVPLRNIDKSYQKWRKRAVIRFGNAICCPSVTYNKKELDDLLKKENKSELFREHFRSNLDWETWEWLSKKDGGFVYINKLLMSHRIHEESETSATIMENKRKNEDYEMFCQFWPVGIAKLLSGVYGESERSNKV